MQRSFGDGLIAVEIKDLQESWMQHADVVLQDDAIIVAVHQALAHRHPLPGLCLRAARYL